MPGSDLLCRSSVWYPALYVVGTPLVLAWIPLSISGNWTAALIAGVIGALLGISIVWVGCLACSLRVDDEGLTYRRLFWISQVPWQQVAHVKSQLRLRAGGGVPDYRALVQLRVPYGSADSVVAARMSLAVRGITQQRAIEVANRIDSLSARYGYSTEREWVTLRPWSQKPPV